MSMYEDKDLFNKENMDDPMSDPALKHKLISKTMTITEEAKQSHHASPLTGFGSLPSFGSGIFELQKQTLQKAQNQSKKPAITGRAQSVLDRQDMKGDMSTMYQTTYGGSDLSKQYDVDMKQKTMIGIGKSQAKMHMKRRQSLWDQVAKEKYEDECFKEGVM